ncbi:MAG: MATE family efflux transporter [Candidatus Rokubacteria bacterium]|nr:MATE family efflux transporter [Candidatus Rokubacteria bacterium]
MTSPAVATAAAPPLAARTRLLLEGAIVPTLLRLAAPNVAVMMTQALVSTADAYWVGRLGPDALAGVSLVFPLIMLMQTMSAGGMGGGVASAVARALGGGRRDDARALVVHAVLIALAMSALFTVIIVGAGPALYRAMGGREGALAAALTYSNIVFAGALAPWLYNTLASVVRGTGNMAVPAVATVCSGLLQLVLSPALVLGLFGAPRLGIIGAGVSMIAAFSLGCVVLIVYLMSPRSLVPVALRGVRFRAAFFADILRVGAPGAANTVLTNLTIVLLTGLVGPFGTYAIAGYGMGARLEYLQIPLVFGFGSALVAMVGTNVGAGRIARAERVAWVGAGLAAAMTGAIGIIAALAPSLWIGLFTSEPAVLAAGSTYLRIVGPFYGFFGLGLALYFASQGAGRLLWPLLGGFLRLLVAAVGGWVVTRELGFGLPALYAVMALALVCFGATVALAVRGGAWRRGRAVETERG